MRAAILVEQRSPLVIDDVELLPLDVGHVRVRVGYSGICGKQVDEVLGKRADPYLPHLLGHEASGVVEEIGPGVRKVKPGDHVVLHWRKAVGIDATPAKFRWRGKHLNAGCVTTFSDVTVVSENRVTKVSPELDGRVAALLGCAVSVGLGIVIRDAMHQPGESMAVFGVGGLGLSVLQAASLVTAHPMVAIDRRTSQLERARRFGATHTLDTTKDDPLRLVKELTGGNGFDTVVDTTGNTDVIQTAYRMTAKTGRTILAGVPFEDKRITIDSFSLHFGQRIKGSHGGDYDPDIDIPRCARLETLGKWKLSKLITHEVSLDRINEGLEAVKNGEVGRCVVSLQARDSFFRPVEER